MSESEQDIMEKYRDSLLETLRFLHESYDKLLVTLSGGALGLSMAFLKDVIKLKDAAATNLLFFAWIAFILSLAAILGRIIFGIEANRKGVIQVDAGTIHSERPGGLFSVFTKAMQYASAIFLLLGLGLVGYFIKENLHV